MRDYKIFDIVSLGKHLFVITVNLEKKGTMNDVCDVIRPLFSEVAPFLKKINHVMYIRDIKKYCIDGVYAKGDAYVESEVKIAIPAWPIEQKDILGTVAHELHHLARWQTVGYGKTLGEAILSEGFAQHYAFEKTGKIDLWNRVEVTDELFGKAFEEWDNAKYSHQEWFFRGPLGQWIGYGIGYQLVKKFFQKGFDLKKSFYSVSADFRKSDTIPS